MDDGFQPPDLAALAALRLRDYAPIPALRRPATPVAHPPLPAVDAHNHLGRWLHPEGGWTAPDVPALLGLMDEVGHPDRVLFGTDAFPPDRQAYQTWYRFLGTDDECFAYAPGCPVPPQGRWEVSALDLPAEVQAAVYAGNARRLLGLG